ncbi:MAG: hypothetical protein R6W48_04685 [Gaiellaceae bacterium]
MSIQAVGRAQSEARVWHGLSEHWAWLAGGLVFAFVVPFVLADVLGVSRDLYYGLYAVAVVGLFMVWAGETGYDLVAAMKRHWLWAIGLGFAVAGVMAFLVLRTEEATARPDGVELIGAVVWRGLVYGAIDGLLLSAFPILVVFAAMAGSRLNQRFRGKVVIGIVAMLASLTMTAAYHAGYSDFRSDKMSKPLTGDLMWSIPTLVTLNPVGAPIAHAGMHTTAVLHSYETNTYLPPHR